MGNNWKFRTNRVDWFHSGGSPRVPVLVIAFDGHSLTCLDRLRELSVDESVPDELDVFFRIHKLDSDLPGVLGIENPLTGEYLLEIEVDRTHIFRFVEAVHRYADETGNGIQYTLWISSEDGLVMDYAMQVLPVFTIDNRILRHLSILPAGVDF